MEKKYKLNRKIISHISNMFGLIFTRPSGFNQEKEVTY